MYNARVLGLSLDYQKLARLYFISNLSFGSLRTAVKTYNHYLLDDLSKDTQNGDSVLWASLKSGGAPRIRDIDSSGSSAQLGTPSSSVLSGFGSVQGSDSGPVGSAAYAPGLAASSSSSSSFSNPPFQTPLSLASSNPVNPFPLHPPSSSVSSTFPFPSDSRLHHDRSLPYSQRQFSQFASFFLIVSLLLSHSLPA